MKPGAIREFGTIGDQDRPTKHQNPDNVRIDSGNGPGEMPGSQWGPKPLQNSAPEGGKLPARDEPGRKGKLMQASGPEIGDTAEAGPSGVPPMELLGRIAG